MGQSTRGYSEDEKGQGRARAAAGMAMAGRAKQQLSTVDLHLSLLISCSSERLYQSRVRGTNCTKSNRYVAYLFLSSFIFFVPHYSFLSPSNAMLSHHFQHPPFCNSSCHPATILLPLLPACFSTRNILQTRRDRTQKCSALPTEAAPSPSGALLLV